jgi:tetratricopeptide (TPR) repeat protein
VAYAHRNLVIHRDLKPSNILVTGDGTPKLLDFGIARLLDRSGEVTLWNARFMTPDFASPEQLLGQRMTTASDIYSLGVLLFVLLTGQPASDLPQARPALRDDLGNIVAMALRADPRDRYSSVEQFAADIRRYLGGLPVRAHRPTFPYRSGKFISRHRIGLAAVLAVAVSLAAAAGFQLRAYHATRRHYDEAMRLAASFAFEVPDAIARTPGTLSARQLIVQRATGYLDDLSREAGRDPSLESELAAAYDRIGSLTFQVEGALALHRKALAIGRRLAWNDPGNPKFLERLSASYGLVGDGLREEGDSTGALENYRNAMNAMKPLARTNPAGLADTYVEMGMMLTRIGRFDEGLAYDAKVMAIRRALLNAAPADIENRRAWIDTRIWMALGMLAAGKVAPALESADAAYRDAESMGAADPANPVCRRHRWVARMIRARALGIRGDFAGAAGEYRRALDLIQSLAESDPGDKGHRRSMAVTWLGLADALAAQGRRSDAERWYARAIAESEKLLREDPRKLETAIDLGRMYSHLGSLYVKTARVSEARAFLEKGRGLIDAASARDPQDAALRSDRTEAYAILGKLR